MGVVITEANQMVLDALAKYYLLSRKMIQDICFPHVRSSRSVCERIRKLKKEGYLSEAKMQIVLQGQNAIPIYHPNKKTAQTLAAIHDNDEYLNILTKPPSHHLLFHWIEIVKTHRLVDLACVDSRLISVLKWINEWEVVNKECVELNQQFSLKSVVGHQPVITCAPDAGFLVECQGFRKVFYVEQDRGTDSIRRIARKKPDGYRSLQQQSLHARHFPATNVDSFGILFITTTEHRRDELANRLKDFEGGELWKLAVGKTLSPKTFFFEPVWKQPNGEIVPLIREAEINNQE